MTVNGGWEMPNHTLFSFFHTLQLFQTMCTCDSLLACVCVSCVMKQASELRSSSSGMCHCVACVMENYIRTQQHSVIPQMHCIYRDMLTEPQTWHRPEKQFILTSCLYSWPPGGGFGLAAAAFLWPSSLLAGQVGNIAGSMGRGASLK